MYNHSYTIDMHWSWLASKFISAVEVDLPRVSSQLKRAVLEVGMTNPGDDRFGDVENPWKTHGKSMKNPWKTHGKPMENQENPWKTHGKSMYNM